jgi:hypothetical protein
MKIASTANPDFVEDEIGEFESIEAEISQDDPGFTFELLSSRLYSNKEGSIVREITSNCFDAHTAAGKLDEPVFIKLYREESQYFLSFKDVGPGMDPKFIQDIYMKYLKSTKRDSNAFIGAYGLGSKSPLSYTDFFYLTTRVDGIEWQYMMHKTKRAPQLELLLQTETDQPNGTIIKIPIETKDLEKFKAEAVRQLFYFTNVYVEGMSGFNNRYTVYDYKTFKYRPMSYYDEQWYTDMHIVVDKVTYPIDWTALKIPAIKASIGLKFEIGELDIPPNRESIEYSAESIVLIKKRIEEARAELTEIANQDRSKICLTIADYNAKVEQLEKHGKLTILMNDENVKLTLTKHISTHPYFISKIAPFRWKPLSHLPISFKENPFFEYQVMKQIGSLGTTKLMKNNMASYLNLPQGKKFALLQPGEQPGRIKNYQLGVGTYLVTKSKRVFKHRSKHEESKTFWDEVTIEGLSVAKGTPFTNGFNKTFLMREYRKIIAQELQTFCPIYKDIVVTESTKLSYRSQFDRRVKREKGIIPALCAAPGMAKHDKEARVELDSTEIEAYQGVLIFGSKEQFSQLRDVALIMGKNPISRYGNSSVLLNENFEAYVFAASEKYTKKFVRPLQKTNNNIFSLEQVEKGECEAFNLRASYHKFSATIKGTRVIPSKYLQFRYYKTIEFFSVEVEKSLARLDAFCTKWKCAETVELLFSQSSLDKILSQSPTFAEQKDLERAEAFFKDLQFLWGYQDTIELDQERKYVQDIVRYLQFKGKDLNPCHSIELTKDERAWRDTLCTLRGSKADEFRLTAPARLSPFLKEDPYLKTFIF